MGDGSAHSPGVIPRSVVPRELTVLARAQADVISRDQARGLGVTDPVIRRLVREERWRRVSAGVYAVGAPTWLQEAWAGLLVGGNGAVLGLDAAAYLQRLSRNPPAVIDVFTLRRIRRPDPRWRFIRGRRDGEGRPARTPLARTIVDLGQTANVDDLAALVARAVTDLRLDPRTIGSTLDQTPHHRHSRLLRDLVAETELGVVGPLERRYRRDVERAHGLPEPLRQASPVGRFYCDVWYEEYGVIVELDGRAYHLDTAQGVDFVRDNVHRLERDLVTLRYSWAHVAGRPCEVARQVGVALTKGGWTGSLVSCSRCPR